MDKFVKQRRSAKRWGTTITVFYIIIFCAHFCVSLVALSGLAQINNWLQLLGLFFLLLIIPLSVPASIVLAWRQYFQKKYTKVRLYSVVFFILVVINWEFYSFLFTH